MQNDDIVWSIINRSFCSFKVSTLSQNFCREPNNLTGLCSRSSCPLANAQYATVREEKGIIYLFIRTAERQYFPVKQWEKIQLSKNFKTALRQIDENLILFKKYFRQKCRQRLLKITQMLARMRKQALDPGKKLVPIKRKINARINKREVKALKAAKTDLAIEKKLLERLKEGVYGGIYNFDPAAFEEVTKEAKEGKEIDGYGVVGEEEEGETSKLEKKVMNIMDKEIEQEVKEEEEEDLQEREYIADFDESEDEDIEDIEGEYVRYLRDHDYDVEDNFDEDGNERYDDDDDDDDDEDNDDESVTSPASKKRKIDKDSSNSKLKELLKKPKIKIEYEEDEEEEEPVMERQKLKVRA